MKAVSPLPYLYITLNIKTETEHNVEGCLSDVPLVYNKPKHIKLHSTNCMKVVSPLSHLFITKLNI